MVAGYRLAMNWGVLLALIGAMWVLMALHTGLSMRRLGRRWWVWFAICLFCTAIPAAVVSYLDHLRQLRQGWKTAARNGRNS